MRPVLIVKIINFPDIIAQVGVMQAVDLVYQMREIGEQVMGRYIVRECDDFLVAVLGEGEDVQMAINMAQELINLLCTDGCRVPLAASIGFGNLYETADGDFWGLELSVAHDLARQGMEGQIILTPASIAEYNRNPSTIGLTLANNNTINEMEIGIDEKAERIGISRPVDMSETDMVTILGDRNDRQVGKANYDPNTCTIM